MLVNRFTRGKLQFILGLSLGITVSFLLTSYVQFTTTSVHVPLDIHKLPLFRHLGQQGALQQARELDEHELHELMEHGDAAAAGQGAKAVHFEDVHEHHGECVCVCVWCVRTCVYERACVRACMSARTCVRACVHVCVCVREREKGGGERESRRLSAATRQTSA